MSQIAFTIPTALTVAGATTLQATTNAILRADSAGVVSTTSLQANLSLSAGVLSLATSLVSINSITSAAAQNLVLATGTGGTALTIASSTLAATFGGNVTLNAGTPTLTIGPVTGDIVLGGTPTGDNYGSIKFIGSNTTTNWRLVTNYSSAGAFEFVPSSAGGGSTFTTAAVRISTAGQLQVLATTASSSTSTGALVVSGGVGIAGALNVAGAASFTSTLGVGPVTITKDTTYTSESTYGLNIVAVGGDTALLLGASAAADASTIQSMQNGTAWATRPLWLMPNGGSTVIGAQATSPVTIAQTGTISIANATASTSTTTGSLINAGGFGNAGAAYIGGKLKTSSYLLATGALASFDSATGGVYAYYSSGGLVGAYSDNSGTFSTLSLDGSQINIRPAGSSTNGYAFTSAGLALGTTTSSITAASATNLTLAGGSSGASLVLGQGTNGTATITPAGTGEVIVTKAISSTTRFLRLTPSGNTTGDTYGISFYNSTWGDKAGVFGVNANSASSAGNLAFYTTDGSSSFAERARVTFAGNVLIGTTTDISGSGNLVVSSIASATTKTAIQITDTGTVADSAHQILSRNSQFSWDQGAIRFTRRGSASDFHVDIYSAKSGALTNYVRLTDNGNFLVGGTTDISGNGGLKVFGTTAATSTTSGALQVAGGVGIAGAVYTGGGIISSGAVSSFGAGTGQADVWIAGGAGSYRLLYFSTGAGNNTTNRRWAWAANLATESGSNTGSDFELRAYSDTGTPIGSGAWLGIVRSTGAVGIYSGAASTSTTSGALTVAGGAGIAGALYVGSGVVGSSTITASEDFIRDGAAGLVRGIRFSTSGSRRWLVYETSTAESGSNAGSDFAIANYTDAAAFISNALTITRANGNVALTSTTEATPAGAGSFTTAGGIYSAKNIIVSGGSDFGSVATSSAFLHTVSGAPRLTLIRSASTANRRAFDIINNSDGLVQMRVINDDLSGATSILQLSYTGTVTVPATTEATTAGAGSLTTSGGIYAAKKIIANTEFQKGNSSGYMVFAVGSSGNTGWYYPTADAGQIDWYANNSFRARFHSSGGLSLGSATDPGAGAISVSNASSSTLQFHAINTNTAGYSALRVQNTGASGRTFDIGTGGSTSGQASRFYIWDDTAGANRLLIDSAGTVSVVASTTSTSTTTGALTVAGGVGVAGAGYFGGLVGIANNSSLSIADSGGTHRRIVLLSAANDVQVGHVDQSWAATTANLYLKSAGVVTVLVNGQTGTFTQALQFSTTANATFAGDVVTASDKSFVFTSRGYISTPADGVFLLRNAAATDFSRLQFGGTSSSYPALSRSGTTLSVVLADGTSGAVLATTGSRVTAITVVTSNTTLTSAHDSVVCNSATPFTVTLPAGPTTGHRFMIKNKGSATVTLSGNGANIFTTVAAASTSLSTGDAVIAQYDGSVWVVM